MSGSQDDLRKWILENMTSEAVSELDLHKEEAAKLVTLSPDGVVIPRIDRTKLDTPTEILLVLLGRAYAAAAGLVESDAVTNDELVRMVKGTPGGQRWALTKLRQENLVATATRGSHHLLPSQVGRAMKAIKEKAAPEEIP